MTFKPTSMFSKLPLLLLLPCVVGAPSAPVCAQNATAPDAKPLTDIQKRDLFVREFAAKAKSEAAAAVADGRAFLAAHPQLPPWERLVVYERMGHHLYFGGPKNAALALEVLDEGLREYPRTEQRLLLAAKKAEVLVAEERLSEAQTMLQELWPVALKGDRRWIHELFSPYATLLRKQKKYDDLAALLIGLIEARPEVLHWFQTENDRRWYWQHRFVPNYAHLLVDALLAAERPDEALRWAKLTYLFSEFRDDHLGQATALLGRAWMSQEMSRVKLEAFVKAQSDPQATNPLREVTTPKWDKTVLSDRLAHARLEGGERLTLLLLRGDEADWREAMLQARRLVLEDPTGEKGRQGAREVARVFKARDLHLVRANQFLEFFRTGEGQNPIAAFLQPQPTP